MTQTERRVIAEEFARLRRDSTDPQLDAVQIAIYLEDALNVVIPEDFLTPERLADLDVAQQIVDALASMH